MKMKVLEGTKQKKTQKKKPTKINILREIKCYIHETVAHKAKARAQQGPTDSAIKEKTMSFFLDSGSLLLTYTVGKQ